MQFEELAALVQSRRSIRRYADREVPDELLQRALDLAVWAPNGGNRQSWAFYVVKDRQLIGKLADAVKAKTELMAGWPEAARFGESVRRWLRTSDFFRNAPVCIAVATGCYESVADQVLAARGAADPQAVQIGEARRVGASRLQSAAAAITTLLLSLHAQGLGACWMAGPQQAKQEIERLLEIPPELDFVALLPVGYPAEEPQPGPRRPRDEVVRFLR
ncbi:MAG: nitroreductase family protein [Chloroflexi bacterium]|nr:nitroreductase family protein [Chloroflexota bacterium]